MHTCIVYAMHCSTMLFILGFKTFFHLFRFVNLALIAEQLIKQGSLDDATRWKG